MFLWKFNNSLHSLIFDVCKMFLSAPRILGPGELARMHQGEFVTALWIFFSSIM